MKEQQLLQRINDFFLIDVTVQNTQIKEMHTKH